MLSKKEQKFIQSLKIKKYRTREKLFLVEGEKNVSELLRSDFKVQLVLATKAFADLRVIDSNIRSEIVSEETLSQLGAFKSNNAVLAVVQMKEERVFRYQGSDSLFALDGVSDPGNLGTIIRTLDWFGFKQLLCSKDCADFYNPKTISSTMGSFTRLEVFYGDLVDFIGSLDLPIYGADMYGTNIYSCRLQAPGVFVMGSESQGIRKELKELIVQQIAIPKIGQSESLNVGVATGIIASYLRMDL